MGVCQAKKQNQKLASPPITQIETNLKTEILGAQNVLSRRSNISPQEKKIFCDSIFSPNTDGNIVISRQRNPISVLKIQNNISGLHTCTASPILETTSASKKYTIIGQHSSNYQISILQNNKTGKLVQMENFQKFNPDNEKYISWLQKVVLDHPNILRIIEIFQDRINYQVVSEHFHGNCLSDLIIGQAKVSKSLVSQIYEQIISAMQYLHSRNIVHGNLTLKSFQYIQSSNGGVIVKLVNLKGIILREEDNLEIIKLLPPECLYHQNLFTKERDIWTVGLIGYTLKKGQLPYNFSSNHTQQFLITIIKDHKFNFSKKKDLVFKNFLESTLAKDPHHRVDFETLLKHQFIKNHRIKKITQQEILLTNFITNKPCCTIQQLLLGYFGQEFNWEEYIAIQKLFSEGDQDMDGLLSKQELIKLFSHYKKIEEIDNKIQEIFQQLEVNTENGGIDSTQFMSLALTRSTLITQQNIETCFQIFSYNKQEIQLKGLKRHLQCETADIKYEFSQITDDLNTLNWHQFESIMKLLLE
ncbi:unnamed protein product [Paramecium primaurelia]|uniref:Protein kinase domain containing protein n=1 Tax=Paramecium primaurelia TaxID=5886 RepID=A0A8S1N2E3_PARPR|nr:unnamed protein product [Paramecium primaurelia]